MTGKIIKLVNKGTQIRDTLENIKKAIVGKTIKDVRYMTDAELKENDWHEAGIVLILEDGHILYPLSDNYEESPGALGTSFKKIPIIETL